MKASLHTQLDSQAGANVDVQNVHGQGPLFECAFHGHAECLKVSSISLQKSPVYPQKSPVYPQKSRVHPQKSYLCTPKSHLFTPQMHTCPSKMPFMVTQSVSRSLIIAKPLHIRERALYICEKALYIRKRALCITYVDRGRCSNVRIDESCHM